MTAPDEPRLTPVRLVIHNAEEVGGGPPEPPPEDGGAELPDGCPVEPLGVADDTCYYLDELKQLRKVPAEKHGRLGLQSLFGAKNYLLQQFWPRITMRDDLAIVTGWKPELAAQALMAAAARKGVWNPLEKVRGRGAWLGEDGELVLHCGDAILAGTRWMEPGIHGRYVYPAYDRVPRPHDRPQPSGERGPAAELLSILRTWNWRNKGIDELLLLGWYCASKIGGAVKWRPVAWVTGDTQSGKSTLQEAIDRLSDGGLVHAAEASAAGVWQKLGHSSLPVAIDEQEAEKDNRKLQALVKLARLAASGGLILRGGADHSSAEFSARSCFLFSSILVPPLLGQDRNRMAILELDGLAGETPPDLSPARLAELGRKLLRRMVDGWSRWPETLENYRVALARAGHSARRCDVFGTLLAAADLALFDEGEADQDIEQQLARRLEHVAASDLEDAKSDQDRWLGFLLSSVLPLEGVGMRRAIGEWIALECENEIGHPDAIEASRLLGLHGLKVMRDPQRKNAPTHLAVSNDHQGLMRVHENTHWAGTSGTMGVWVQSARRLPLAEAPKKTLYFAGARTKGTLIPIDLVWSVDDADRRAELRRQFQAPGLYSSN